MTDQHGKLLTDLRFPLYPHLDRLVAEIHKAIDAVDEQHQLSVTETLGVLELVKHQLLQKAYGDQD